MEEKMLSRMGAGIEKDVAPVNETNDSLPDEAISSGEGDGDRDNAVRPLPEKRNGLVLPSMNGGAGSKMHHGAFSGKNGVESRRFQRSDNRFYLLGSDATAFHEISSSSIDDTPQVPSMADLRFRMAAFNSANAKALVTLHGPEKALEDATDKFLSFCAEIQRADILSESGMMTLRLDQTKAVQMLEAICKEGGLDFTKRVAKPLPQIGMRALKDYYRMLRYADIYDMRCLGKKRSVSLLAVIEKDAGKGKKKRKAWEGETPILDYLVKHGVTLPQDKGTPNVEAFKYDVDVLINSRRAKHEGLVISPALLAEFTRECGELKRAHFDDLRKFSGDEARLRSRLCVFVDNDGNAPRLEADPDKIQGLIRKLDNILDEFAKTSLCTYHIENTYKV